jgi:ketosteroid isomerase-like protein
MTVKNRTSMVFVLVAVLALSAFLNGSRVQAAAQSSAARDLTAILQQFMIDAGRNNAAGFESFFADDVLYTRSTGAVITKADIMKSLRGAAPVLETTTTYSAEDITVHEYGDTAIVAFRLVRHEEHNAGKPPSLTNYRNTGTFLRRNGRWQAIAWQSTIVQEAPKAN